MDDLPQNMPGTAASVPQAVERPWLAHYSTGVPQTIAVPDRPLPWLLDEAARRYSAHTAIDYYGTRLTYAQLSSLADRFARALIRLGVRRGDRVSLALPNIPQFPIAFFGALKAGAVAVPTNPLYTERELEHQLRDAGVKVAVVFDQLYPTISAVRANVPVEHVILASPSDYLPGALALAYNVKTAAETRGKPHADAKALRADPTLHHFKDLLGHTHDRQGFEVFPLPEPAAPGDVAVLQYTGGTTGVAKGAMLTHHNLLANAMQAAAWMELPVGPDHISLCVAPFFHVYGLTVAMNLTVMNGATMVLLPRFTVKDTLNAIEKYKPDLFPGVPTMYLALARRFDDAVEAARDAVTVQRELGDRRAEGVALNNLAAALLDSERYDEAIAAAREAATIFRETHDRHREGVAATHLGGAFAGAGQHREGVAAYEKAAGIFRDVGDRHGESRVLTNLGNALRQDGTKLEEIIDLHRRSAMSMAEAGDQHSEGIALTNLTASLIDAGRFDEAVAVARTAVPLMHDVDDMHGLGGVLVNLGMALLEVGQAGEAAEVLGDAVTAYHRSGDHDAEAEARISLGDALRTAGNREAAVAALRDAADSCNKTASHRRKSPTRGNLGFSTCTVL